MASLTSNIRPGMENQRDFMFQIINYRNPNAISQNDDGTYEEGVVSLLASDIDLDDPTDETMMQFRAKKMQKLTAFNDLILDKINMVERFRNCVGFAEGDMAEKPVKKKAKKAQDFWLSLIDLSKTKRKDKVCVLRNGTERKFRLYDWKDDDGYNGEQNCATGATQKGFDEFKKAILKNIIELPELVDTMRERRDTSATLLLAQEEVENKLAGLKTTKKSLKNKSKKEKQKAKKAAKAAREAEKVAEKEKKKAAADFYKSKFSEKGFAKVGSTEEELRFMQRLSPTNEKEMYVKQLARLQKKKKGGKTRRKKKQRKRGKSKRRTKNKKGGMLILGAYAAYKYFTSKKKRRRRKKTKKR